MARSAQPQETSQNDVPQNSLLRNYINRPYFRPFYGYNYICDKDDRFFGALQLGRLVTAWWNNETQPKCPIINSSVVLSTSTCDHNAAILSSTYGDIKIIVPEGAIKKGDEVKFDFATALFSPFEIATPNHFNLVSPYYWIGVSTSYCFLKEVEVLFEYFTNNPCYNPSHFSCGVVENVI